MPLRNQWNRNWLRRVPKYIVLSYNSSNRKKYNSCIVQMRFRDRAIYRIGSRIDNQCNNLRILQSIRVITNLHWIISNSIHQLIIIIIINQWPINSIIRINRWWECLLISNSLNHLSIMEVVIWMYIIIIIIIIIIILVSIVVLQVISRLIRTKWHSIVVVNQSNHNNIQSITSSSSRTNNISINSRWTIIVQ